MSSRFVREAITIMHSSLLLLLLVAPSSCFLPPLIKTPASARPTQPLINCLKRCAHPRQSRQCFSYLFGKSCRQAFSRCSRAGALRSTNQVVETAARPSLEPGFYKESLLDKVALGLFRMLVQKEIGYKSDKAGYDGLIDEAQNYMVNQGSTAEEQQDMVVRVLEQIAGPAVPPVYKLFMAPWPWAPFLTAFFTPPFFKFLVGPNKLDVRKDGTAGGVFVERCRFLEETNCKGLCTNMCKVPTERFFQETLGLTMAMEPDFDTYECRLSFGLTAPPMEEDESVPRGCLAECSCRELGAQVATTCSKQ